MKSILIILLFSLSMCNSKQNPEKNFEGTYKGNHDGVSAAADLRVDGKQLSGEVTLNDKVATINGRINGLSTTGSMKDEETGQLYKYRGSMEDDKLTFSFSSPDDETQKVQLVMYRNGRSSSSPKELSKKTETKNPASERNADLVGVWKNTEVLGGGDMSFSTENFMELKEDGTMLSWTGRSAGSGISRDSDEANASRVEWYTDGNKLYFVDPATKDDDYILYSVSESGLLLHNGGAQKKVFQRVR
jgi:hypothetical protein